MPVGPELDLGLVISCLLPPHHPVPACEAVVRSPTQHLGPEEKEQLLSSGTEGQGHSDRPQMFCDCPQLPAEPLLKGTSARDGLELTGTVASEEGEHCRRRTSLFSGCCGERTGDCRRPPMF